MAFKMKVLLHGATNGSNFGDFLFAKIFYEELEKNYHEVYFYDFPKIGISKFFRKNLNYEKKTSIRKLLQMDALVYISGGYFGERKGGVKESIIRFIRYIPIGLLFMKLKKKIYIIGVGGAPISNKWLRGKFVKITNYADLVIFRDKKTSNYYKKHGVDRDVVTSTDTALLLSKVIIPDKNNAGVKLMDKKNHMFIHLSGNLKTDKQIERVVIPAVNEFIKRNNNWVVIVGQDNIYHEDYSDVILKKVHAKNKLKFFYDDPMKLFNLIGSVDLILTPKLHVGIIGSSLMRSVISFPYHANKTKRFYEQIGYPERCTPLNVLRTSSLLNDILKYKDNKIVIPEELIQLSKTNISLLLDRLNGYEK